MIEGPKKSGLSPEHHGDLNRPESTYPGGKAAKDAKIKELRELYAHDPIALQYLDGYDAQSEYHVKMKEYIETFKSEDTAKRQELQAWFREHYPDIK